MGKLVENKGLYFEEFEVGMRIITEGRTVCESDITSFAGVSGDFNPMHTDAAFAAKTPFGQRVAHGALIFSIATGLIYRTRILEGTVIAFRSIDDWKFSAPIYIGDTIQCELEVSELKQAARLGGGMVVIVARVFNQEHVLVQKGSLTAIVASKPAN